MPELSETEGCDLLTRLFRSRGYAISRNVQFREYGVEFHIDGWDAKARVGFEFLSSEDDDHIDLSLEEYKTLGMAQQRGELALFIIDEVETLSAAELIEAANEFLDEVDQAALERRTGRSAKKKLAVKKKAAASRKAIAARKPAAAGKAVAKKKVATKAAKRTSARQKPVKKKAAKKAAKKVARKKR